MDDKAPPEEKIKASDKSTGIYHFMGKDVSGFERDELARLRREDFGFVFQSYNLIGTASALQTVEVPAVYSGMPPGDRHARAKELLGTLGLGERLAHRPSQLSCGQQQRVLIARSLMNGGHIVLADEPTGALDSKSGLEVMALMKELSEHGHTVILITHAADVAKQAQRTIEISDGRIVSDSGSQILAAPAGAATQPDSVPPRNEGGASLLGGAFEASKTAVRAVLAQRAAIPQLELQERQTLFALALLLGKPPEGFVVGLAAASSALSIQGTWPCRASCPGYPPIC